MKVYDKIAKVERLLRRLSNQNRDLESYKDDLYYCFYECWHIKDYILNDDAINNIYEAGDFSKLLHNECVNKSIYLKICADIANREKHLKLRNSRSDGEINKSEVGLHISECISASVKVKIDFIHIDDLEEYDEKRKKLEEMEKDNYQKFHKCNDKLSQFHQGSGITQKYFVTNDSGEIYDALEVINKSLDDWKCFIDSLSIDE